MTARAELIRALGNVTEMPEPRPEAIAALGLEPAPEPGDHATMFLFNAYPYASVQVGPEGMLGGEARDRVAGFWRAIGMTPPAEPDHLAALLGLYAALIDAEAGQAADGDRAGTDARRAARVALLWEHLASWLPPYLDAVRAFAPPFHQRWAALVDAVLLAEIEDAGPPDRLPLHLREAPGLPPDEAPAADWVSALLAPVRAGMVVTRWEMRAAADRLGLGTRAGERAFVLRSMLGQDAAGTVGWLAETATAAADRHAARVATMGSVAAFWRDRATACAIALRRVVPESDAATSFR